MSTYDYFIDLLRSRPFPAEPVAQYTTLNAFKEKFITWIINKTLDTHIKNKSLYLLKVRRDLETIKNNLHSDRNTVNKHCEKYKIPYDDIVSRNIFDYNNNELMLLLNSGELYSPESLRKYTDYELKIIQDFLDYWNLTCINEVLENIKKIESDTLKDIGLKENKGTKTTLSFPDYLQFDLKSELAKELKDGFDGAKGKSIALLISDLSQRKPPLLTIVSRGNAKFYKALQIYFDSPIGSDYAINKYLEIPANKYKNNLENNEIETCKTKIDKILLSINKKA